MSQVDRARQGSSAGTSLALSTTFAAIALIIAVPLFGWIASATGSPRLLVVASAVFGVAAGMRAISERLVAASGAVSRVAQVKVAEGSIILLATVAGFAVGVIHDWAAAMLVVIGAAVVAVAAYLVSLRRLVGPMRFDRADTRPILGFARHAAPATVFSVAIIYVDKFALRIGADDITYAQYSAYFASTLLIAAQVVFVLQGVVLPAAARTTNPGAVRRQLRARLPWLVCVLPLLYLASSAFIVRMLGDDFEFRPDHAVIFAAWATAFTLNVLLMTASIARSHQAMRRESRVLIARTIVLVAFLVLLVAFDQITLVRVAVAMLVVELAESCNVASMFAKVFADQPTSQARARS